MKTLKALFTLIVAFPKIIELLETIHKRIEEAETQRKVEDDLKAINEAFKNQDAEALRKIFNS